MNYIDRCRLNIESASLDPARPVTRLSSALESECADAIMDGCAAELAGVDLNRVTPECRARILATIDAINGYAPTLTAQPPRPSGPAARTVINTKIWRRTASGLQKRLGGSGRGVSGQ